MVNLHEGDLNTLQAEPYKTKLIKCYGALVLVDLCNSASLQEADAILQLYKSIKCKLHILPVVLVTTGSDMIGLNASKRQVTDEQVMALANKYTLWFAPMSLNVHDRHAAYDTILTVCEMATKWCTYCSGPLEYKYSYTSIGNDQQQQQQQEQQGKEEKVKRMQARLMQLSTDTSAIEQKLRHAILNQKIGNNSSGGCLVM